jgi:hypothetical protein
MRVAVYIVVINTSLILYRRKEKIWKLWIKKKRRIGLKRNEMVSSKSISLIKWEVEKKQENVPIT